MKTALWIAALAALGALFFLLDRLLLKMEELGWIYYRKKQGHADRLGQAAFRVQAILEPDKQYVLEEKERDREEDRDSGAPPR
jgi:hypothetical protein